MNTELPPKYDPSAVETQAYQVWLDEKCFRADPAAPGEPYSIVIPPPNVTGALHLGHAINTTLQDILTRMHRMMGYNTLWVPGIDHAGIATQAVVEKQLKELENKTRHDVGREGLVERIWKWKEQYGNRILEQLKRLGCSCDWDHTRFTLDEMCAKAVRETFFKLFKDGLIYRGKRLVNWDTYLQTSISDDEIYHEKVKTSLWHIRYPIEDVATEQRTPAPSLPYAGERAGVRGGSSIPSRNQSPSQLVPSPQPSPLGTGARGPEGSRPTHMIVATTRPETMLGDTAVAVHSQDPRWNWAIGKHVRLPLTNRLIPIIADDILVDPTFGTGVVKVTPAHDPNDYAVWGRHKGQPDEIDLINILTPDGKITSDRPEWAKYAGLKRDAARKLVVQDLEAAGLLEKEEPYETEVGHSDRSKTAIEPYLSDQWFVKMAPLAEPALQVVRDGTIKFYPERHAQQYLSWLGEKRDWPVSRQLWWGHRIPVWTFLWDGPVAFAPSDSQQVRMDLPYLSKGQNSQIAVQVIRPGNANDGRIFVGISVRPGFPEIERLIEQHGGEQDPDVLDTWFSSALWPHSTLGWPEQTADLAKYYPTSILLTGRDIITLWVARMVMMGMYNMGSGNVKRDEEGSSSHVSRFTFQSDNPQANLRAGKELGIPFFDVAINPTILDGKGERMSKSKGNGVDPVDIIDSYGADALRFTLTKMATETQDVRLPVKKDAQGKNTSDKFDEGRNFCNKLWNACRFVLANLVARAARPWSGDGSNQATGGPPVPPTLADRWIISRFHKTLEEAEAAIKIYRFDVYAKACYDFFWRDFCDWYLEAIKPAMKDPARAPQTADALAALLDGSLRLMHPMIPFITETIWWKLNEVRPDRGLPGLLECPPSKRLVLAAWPIVARASSPCPESAQAETTFPKLQELIVAIRTIRNDYQVNPRQTVNVSIRADGDFAKQIEAGRELVETLATSVLKEVGVKISPVANAVSATAAGCEIFVEGLVDPDAERQRLTKEAEAETKSIAALDARLGNEAYIAKAPPNLVKQTQDQLAAAKAKLLKIQEALKKLG